MNLNKALIIGNLTRDPELRTLPSGQPVATFSIATNRSWTKDGQKQEQVEFHNVVAFGKPAELISQYMKKGSSMFVEGRIQTRSWDGQDGQKKYKTEIIVENFQFGPRPQGGGHASGEQRKEPPPAKDEDIGTIEYPEGGEEINPNDIPF